MIFTPEVKNFTKNTLILTLFFSLVLQLSWGYILPIFESKTNAGANDLNFSQAGIEYMGSIATAMSLSIGQKDPLANKAGVDLSSTTISIAEVLSKPNLGQQKLIGGNMLAVSQYKNIISTDIVHLLDVATDRQKSLDEHILLLKNTYNTTQERIKIINEQVRDLEAIISQATTNTNGAKETMQQSYNEYDYRGIDTTIDTYVKAKNTDTRARVYLIYMQGFLKNYTVLQGKNLKIIDALTKNRDALIKHSTIIVPNSGYDIIKTLKLIQNESDIATNTVIQ